MPLAQLEATLASAQNFPAAQGAQEVAPLPVVEASVPAGQLSPPRATSLAPVTDSVPPQATWMMGLGSVVALTRESATSEPDLTTLTMAPALRERAGARQAGGGEVSGGGGGERRDRAVQGR